MAASENHQTRRKIIEIDSNSDENGDGDDVFEELNYIETILCDDGPQQQPMMGNLNKWNILLIFLKRRKEKSWRRSINKYN